MRKRFFVLVSFLILTSYCFSLDITYTVTKRDSIGVNDTSDKYYIYFPEPGIFPGSRRGNHGVYPDTTTDINSTITFNNQYTISGYIDSLKANTVIDSVWGRVRTLDVDKKPFGDYYYFDFANGDTAVAIDYIENLVPQNRSASDTPTTASFSINFKNVFPQCHGLEVEIGMSQVADADSLGFKLNHAIGMKK